MGIKSAPTAEAMMRSRYSAYATQNADYLVNTTHFSTRKQHTKSAILEWAKANQWVKLAVIAATSNTVTFKAFYVDQNGISQIHWEHSLFALEDGSWFYVDGDFL
jgi:SEC-C motif-containing protein